jgi:two-component system CheB/CheR fusion protein
MATLALILLVIYWARRRSKTLIDPLLALRNRAQAIAETNDLTLPIPKGGIDEVGQLAEAIDSMVRAIRSADATRKEAQERFRLVFETSSEAAIFAWPDGRIESANAEALRLFGYTLDEVCALGRSGVMDINDPRLGPALEQRARTGSFRGELRCRRKDGSLFPVEVVSTIFHDSNGEVRSSSMFRDVTEQKQIHADLQASLETLRIRDNALAAISQGVLISGPDRRITYASEAFQSITGYAASEIIGRSCSLLHGAATNPETKALIQDRLNAGEPFHGEILNYRKNGSSFWNDLSITPVFDSAGTLIQFVGVQRDVSARIEGEKRLKSLSKNLVEVQEAARRHLASELHDRTSANLAAIVINMDAAWMSLQAREWQVVAERLGDNRALVEDTSASIREICAELRPPALDYAGLIPAVESYANLFARRTGIAIHIDNTGDEEKLTPEIKSTLFRIVQEALTNVAKHAEASMINIELALDGQPLRLSVADDGSGFELAGLHSRGLGIINMQEMAEFSGGSFYLASTPGGGTRISVELPNAEKPA